MGGDAGCSAGHPEPLLDSVGTRWGMSLEIGMWIEWRGPVLN
jgi:hypothetical protein